MPHQSPLPPSDNASANDALSNGASPHTEPLRISPPAKHPVRILTGADASLSKGFLEIVAGAPHRFSNDSAAVGVRFTLDPALGGRLVISGEAASGLIEVRCGDAPCAFRALGIILGRLEAGLPVARQEHRAFEGLGIMLDASRNGVMRPEVLHRLIRHLALMGFNQLMLYTEDTYEIPGEPMFGYFRGRYTQQELRQIDDYAALFGIEVIPCIQTLGHMEQVLKWPGYRPLQDAPGVLLCDDDAADAFIRKMITAASEPLRSRRIHIGMDEADGVGAGIYRVRHGARPAFDIITAHLQKTVQTCQQLGLRPMIWSDMFFRLGSQTHDYYDRESVISSETIARVPDGVDFVYWDYYHSEQSFYEEWISRHRAMGKEPIYAGGIWTWNRWWAQLKHTLKTLRAGMNAARASGLKEAVATVWSDDGSEADVFSILPGLQFFAEMGYGDEAQADQCLAVNLRGSCEADAQAWIDASDLDLPPAADPETFHHANPSKWLLWLDPLLGFLDKHVPASFEPHYRHLAQQLARAACRGGEDARLLFPCRVAETLALKCRLHHSLRPAYRAKDTQTLLDLQQTTLPALRHAVAAQRELHSALWRESYRVFGWETLERRYAGLLARLDTLEHKLGAWLQDPQTAIEELDCETTEVWPQANFFNTTLRHHQLDSASSIP